METTHVSRRRLIQLMIGVAAGLALSPSRQTSGWRDRHDELGARLAALFSQPRSAAVIGQAYLQQYAQEADALRLHHLIARDVAQQGAGLHYAGDAELRDLLQQRIWQDFADDRVVKLNGWILSVTEARLYALAALAGEPRAGV